MNGVSCAGDVVARDFRPGGTTVRGPDQRAIVCRATEEDIVRTRWTYGKRDVVKALTVADAAR